MGKLEAQIQSEYDYAGMPFEGSTFVSEARHSKLPLLSTGINIYSWRYQHIKRWVDIAGSLLMIAGSLIPGILIAAAIALSGFIVWLMPFHSTTDEILAPTNPKLRW